MFTLRVARIIEAKARIGEVATDLMKPVDFQMMTLATAIGTSIHTLLFNMLPKVVLFLRDIQTVPSIIAPDRISFYFKCDLGVRHFVRY